MQFEDFVIHTKRYGYANERIRSGRTWMATIPVTTAYAQAAIVTCGGAAFTGFIPLNSVPDYKHLRDLRQNAPD